MPQGLAWPKQQPVDGRGSGVSGGSKRSELLSPVAEPLSRPPRRPVSAWGRISSFAFLRRASISSREKFVSMPLPSADGPFPGVRPTLPRSRLPSVALPLAYGIGAARR